VEGGQVPERDCDVDVVGQVPAGVVGHDQETGQEPLPDVMGGEAAVVAPGHAAVLGDGPQAVRHLPQTHPGSEPADRIQQRPAPGHRGGEQDDLDGNDLAGFGAARARLPFDRGVGQRLQVLPAGDEEHVAGELAAQGVGGDRVAGVEAGVGFLGAHFVAVVGHVGPAVAQRALQGGVAEQPAADLVVPPLAGEEQPVGRLVAEDVELAVTTAHDEEGDQVRPPGVHDAGRDDHTARLQQR